MGSQTPIEGPSTVNLNRGNAAAGKDPRDRLAVALDFPSTAQALAFIDRLDGTCRWFKVGLELFYASGAGLVHTLCERDFKVFLDLKLHDIPNTVAGAVRSATQTGASLLTIHAAGGERMMTAAAEAALAPGAPRLLAVTVLTSMDAADLSSVGIIATPADQVMRLAKLAQRSGITGMVCSPLEAAALRADLAPETLLVVPGIRLADDIQADQRRIATPTLAIGNGASLLVVGRPITQATNPAAVAAAMLHEIEGSF